MSDATIKLNHYINKFQKNIDECKDALVNSSDNGPHSDSIIRLGEQLALSIWMTAQLSRLAKYLENKNDTETKEHLETAAGGLARSLLLSVSASLRNDRLVDKADTRHNYELYTVIVRLLDDFEVYEITVSIL